MKGCRQMPDTGFQEFSEIVMRYGPFAFSILYGLFVPRWAWKKYEKEKQKAGTGKIHMLICFWVAMGAGLAFSGVAVNWWISYGSPGKMKERHIYTGKIMSIHHDDKTVEEVAAALDNMSFKRPLPQSFQQPPMRTEHFVIIQDQPFEEDQEIPIYFNRYTPGKGPRHNWRQWNIRISKKPFAFYRLPTEKEIMEYDSKRNVSEGFFSIFPVKTAWARQPMRPFEYDTFDILNIGLIERLQQESTPSKEKMNIINELLKMKSEVRQQYLDFSTHKEPLIVTICDLARHTNYDLACKAKELLRVESGIVGSINRQISKEILTEQKRMLLELIISRLEPSQALNTLNEVMYTNNMYWIDDIYKRLVLGKITNRALIPSESPRGDRYYVMATWKAGQKQIYECLTYLFNRSLISSRTLEQEGQLMGTRNWRLVYWYSKEWSLAMAQSIEDCGGKAAFVAEDHQQWLRQQPAQPTPQQQ